MFVEREEIYALFSFYATQYDGNIFWTVLSDKRPELNNKYEKKVHFARLMNKVQAEISSYSDVDVGLLKEEDNEMKNSIDKPLAASTQTLIYQPKSPHSTSSNQGSDSLSSSEMTLISASGIERPTYIIHYYWHRI